MIPIRNKKGIISHTKIDNDDYETVNLYFWHLNVSGYAQSNIGTLHRFIMKLKKGDPIVDHINNDKLDNRKCNLRLVNASQNNQNKTKKPDVSSKYTGVYFHKQENLWRSLIRTEDGRKTHPFSIETHAAYWYDVIALKYYGEGAKLNGINRPEDFIDPVEKEKNKHKNIKLTQFNTYHTSISNKCKIIYVGTFKKLEEALIARDSAKKEIEKDNEIMRKNIPILKNDSGNCIIETSDKRYVIVDEDKYYELIKYKWYIHDGYTYGHVPGKNNVIMHRFLMGAKNGEIIDHINNNKLDNRMCNLRVSNPSLNGHNKTKKNNASSKYIGVNYIKTKNRYRAVVSKDKIQYFLGTFEKEEDAARVRDAKALELYGEFAKLNFPITQTQLPQPYIDNQ